MIKRLKDNKKGIIWRETVLNINLIIYVLSQTTENRKEDAYLMCKELSRPNRT